MSSIQQAAHFFNSIVPKDFEEKKVERLLKDRQRHYDEIARRKPRDPYRQRSNTKYHGMPQS